MIIIGVDFHPEFQQIASVDTDTGEFQEKRLAHREEAENFYGARCSDVSLIQISSSREASGYSLASKSGARVFLFPNCPHLWTVGFPAPDSLPYKFPTRAVQRFESSSMAGFKCPHL